MLRLRLTRIELFAARLPRAGLHQTRWRCSQRFSGDRCLSIFERLVFGSRWWLEHGLIQPHSAVAAACHLFQARHMERITHVLLVQRDVCL